MLCCTGAAGTELQGLAPSSGNQFFSDMLGQSVQLMDPDLQFQQRCLCRGSFGNG